MKSVIVEVFPCFGTVSRSHINWLRQKPFKLPALVASLTLISSVTQAQTLPDGAAKPIVERACSQCHPLSVVTNAGHSADDWKIVINAMVFRGARLSPDQVPVVTDYLAKNLPKKPPNGQKEVNKAEPPVNKKTDLSGY